jgi:hypothetical protein
VTVRSLFATVVPTLAALATGACSGGGIAPENVLSPPLVDGVGVANVDGLTSVAREFYQAFGPINDSHPTPRPVAGTGVFEGRTVVGTDGGALFAFGDARMVVDFDAGNFAARFDNFQNHDADGVPTEALAGALDVANGQAAGPGFWGDVAGQLTGATDVFDLTGRVEGKFGERGAPVLAGRISGTVSGSETGPAVGLFYGSRPQP